MRMSKYDTDEPVYKGMASLSFGKDNVQLKMTSSGYSNCFELTALALLGVTRRTSGLSKLL